MTFSKMNKNNFFILPHSYLGDITAKKFRPVTDQTGAFVFILMSICIDFQETVDKLAKECSFKFNSILFKQMDFCIIGGPLLLLVTFI